MNVREPSQSFEAARRQHLIDATIEALADVGFKAASLSQIARRADVSTGLFAHYFGDKDGLLEATLRFMAARLVRATRQRLRAAKTPRERLYAVPDSALADQEFERRTSAVWLAFWGQITHSARYQRIQILYQRRMLSNLRHDLRPLVPPDCVELYATFIASMIDGVWIRSHAAPAQTDGAHARAIVRLLIDGLITGASKTSTSCAAPPAISPPFDAPGSRSQRRVRTFHKPIKPDVAGMGDHEKEIAQAVAEARQGLKAWRGMTARERANILRRCGDAMRAEAECLARLEARCTGRAIRQTLDFSLPRALHAFAASAILASRPVSECAELGPGLFEHKRREPVGIVAGFGHWSASLLDVCCQAAPALAFGNAMIFQPPPQATLTSVRIAELLNLAGVPAGLLTVLRGDPETTERLLTHADAAACDPFDDRAAKPATIIFKGASISDAAAAVLWGYRRWAHVPDYSENRIFVQRAGLADFRACLVKQAERMAEGDLSAPGPRSSGLPPTAHFREVLTLVDHAIGAGATCLLSGKTCDRGVFSSPTILDGCSIDMPLVQRRQFAPVITLIAFEDDDEIVRLIAKDRSTVATGIFDADVNHAHQVASRLQTHHCFVNDFALLATEGDGVWASPVGLPDVFSYSKLVFCRDTTRLD